MKMEELEKSAHNLNLLIGLLDDEKALEALKTQLHIQAIKERLLEAMEAEENNVDLAVTHGDEAKMTDAALLVIEGLENEHRNT